MPALSYVQRLAQRVSATGTSVCVGLDPRWDSLPAEIRDRERPHCRDRSELRAAAFEEFCLRIIDRVAGLVPAVKPQAAFFEELGPAGCQTLGRVIRAARRAGLIVICDAKRGDIGTTAEAYARGYLAGEDPESAPWGADALTVSPYLGADTLDPFVKVATERGAGIYVLVRTSNPGAGSFQDPISDGLRTYERVAAVVEQLSDRTRNGEPYGPIGAVVGATYPQELIQLRTAMPHVPILVPGYGAQGGTARDVVTALDSAGQGALVNSSRGIIFAYERKDYRDRFAPTEWEQAVEQATREMIADLSAARGTPAR